MCRRLPILWYSIPRFFCFQGAHNVNKTTPGAYVISAFFHIWSAWTDRCIPRATAFLSYNLFWAETERHLPCWSQKLFEFAFLITLWVSIRPLIWSGVLCFCRMGDPEVWLVFYHQSAPLGLKYPLCCRLWFCMGPSHSLKQLSLSIFFFENRMLWHSGSQIFCSKSTIRRSFPPGPSRFEFSIIWHPGSLLRWNQI